MTSPIPRMRLTTPNFPGQDLVNKFIAATPSYMYTPIVGQHSFYFSELLRSLSQAKKAEMINLSREAVAQQQLQANRKVARKRTWSQLRLDNEQEPKGDRPLELTSKNSAFSPKINNTDTKQKSESPEAKQFRCEEKAKSEEGDSNSTSGQENLILPPPPPIWYPPLYTPYSGIDPANFFVDLRVSGTIFERKRELAAQALKTVTNNNNLPSYFDGDYNKNRTGSAFSVPKSRELKTASNAESPKFFNQSEDENCEDKPKRFYDNGVTVYNIDSDEEGCRKMEHDESDEEENIAVDEN